MRNDLASLNSGKGMAQSAHCANQANRFIRDTYSEDSVLINGFNAWEEESGHGFGTTIVLSANESQMRAVVRRVSQITDREEEDDHEVVAGITHDPSYPLWDGKTLHQIPLDTCAFVFMDSSNMELRADIGIDPKSLDLYGQCDYVETRR